MLFEVGEKKNNQYPAAEAFVKAANCFKKTDVPGKDNYLICLNIFLSNFFSNLNNLNLSVFSRNFWPNKIVLRPCSLFG